jgi:hypothetical protein
MYVLAFCSTNSFNFRKHKSKQNILNLLSCYLHVFTVVMCTGIFEPRDQRLAEVDDLQKLMYALANLIGS